jgi:hypothetical protein
MGKLVHQAGRAAESVPGTGSWNSEAMMAKLIYSAIASAGGYDGFIWDLVPES